LVFPVAVSCFPGLATILAGELDALGLGPAELVCDSLVLPNIRRDIPNAEALSLLRPLRVARRFLRLVYSGSFQNISELFKDLSRFDFKQAIEPTRSFAVSCWRFGHHEELSPDIAREIGAVVRIQFRDAGLTMPPVQLKNPDQLILTQLLEDKIWVGLDLAGELDRRESGTTRHDAPLNPSIAAAMLRFGGFESTQKLLDPMAGGGTIICEAAKAAMRQGTVLNAIAADNHPKAFARLNEALLPLNDIHSIQQFYGDASQLGYLPETFDGIVITNPPYGLRLGNGFKVDQLYRNFARACRHHNIRSVTGITPRKRSWLESFESADYEIEQVLPVLYDRMTVWLMRHRLNIHAG
jgi:23S rRNA G2445 N2-methylase RlmL